jgi:hypothetical protein
MKPQDHVTMIINVVVLGPCTTLILMVEGHQRTKKIISDHLHRKEAKGPSIKDPPPHTAREAHTQRNLHTACTMEVKPTITPKIVPFSLKPSRKWSKNPLDLRTNNHPEK